MRIKQSTFLLAFIAAIFLGCQAPEQQETAINLDEVRKDFQDKENTYAEGQNTKNADAIMAYYSDDAQSLPTGEPTVVGKEAIRARIEKQLAEDESGNSISFEVVEVFADGDLAIEIGRSVITDPEGNVVSTGKYMSLFEKRDGEYVCIRDIWNSDSDDDEEEDDGSDEESSEESDEE